MLPSRSEDEATRLQALQDICDCNKRDAASLGAIFDITKKVLSVESANYTLIGESCVNIRQTNSCIITEGIDISTQARAICYWTLVPEDPQVMIVEDMTMDARTSDNVLTTQAPHLRFYAAVPLVTCNKQRIGTLCLIDTKPQQFGSVRAAVLSNLAEILMWLLEGNVAQQRPESPILVGDTVRAKQVYQQACAMVDISTAGWRIMYANKPLVAIAGECAGTEFWQLMQGPDGMEEVLAKLQPDQSDSMQAFCMRNVRLRGQGQGREVLYDLELRPASTSRLHRNAYSVGAPARPNEAADDLAPGLNDYFFVLLTASRGASAPSRTPIRHLTLGTILGAGDFAKVFRGTFCSEKVAVKIVKDPGGALLEGDVPLEALLLEGLSHSSVVGYRTWKMATTAAGQQRLWIVMDFCNRGTLAEAVDKGWFRTSRSHLAAPSSVTILATVRDIAAGLEYLHANNIIHCDLSGGNVLLDSCDPSSIAFTAKLADFGFARRLGVDYPGRPPSGNYAYLAPEVMEGKDHSQASDIWSLGVLLQEMLTGEKAWGGLNHSQIAYAVLWQKRRLDVAGEGFLQGLALLCMEREAAARPSANEVLRLVEEEAGLLLRSSKQSNGAANGAFPFRNNVVA